MSSQTYDLDQIDICIEKIKKKKNVNNNNNNFSLVNIQISYRLFTAVFCKFSGLLY